MKGDQQPYALVAPFLRVALLVGLMGGFGLGAALALGLAARRPLGAWWPAAVATHARVQLLDFLGLFILATGLHFLPRLRGSPLAAPRAARAGLVAFAAGTLASAAAPPLSLAAPLLAVCQVVAAIGDGVALVGTVAVAAALVRTLRSGPPLGQRGGLTAVLPYLAFGMGSLVLALLVRATGDLLAVLTAGVATATAWETAVDDLLLYGFATAMALAVSARLLPIYLGVEVVGPLELRVVLACLAAGVAARSVGDAVANVALSAVAGSLLGVALVAFPLVAGVPIGRRRAVRAADPPAFAALYRAANALIRSAFAWLVLSGAMLLLDGVATLATGTGLAGADATRHATAVGYLTLLIFGVGARMLPGFARLRPRPSRLLWAVLALGNVATLCRCAPAIAPRTGTWGVAMDAAFGISGLLGLAAVGLFAVHIWPALYDAAPRARERATVRAVRGR